MRRLAVALACLVPLGAALPAMAADALPDEVEYQLIYMREEEKLAHDVYLLFDGLYGGTTPGAQVFQRITLGRDVVAIGERRIVACGKWTVSRGRVSGIGPAVTRGRFNGCHEKLRQEKTLFK